MHWKPLLPAARWAATTLAAALLGGAVAMLYNSARPSIALVDIRTSLSANDAFVTPKTEVKTPQDIRRLIEDTFWGSIEGFREPSTRYSDLLEALDENEERMKSLLVDINSLSADLSSLRSILKRGPLADTDERNSFFDLWERNDGFIYGCIKGDFNRGVLKVASREYAGEPFFLLEKQTIDPYDENTPAIWTVYKAGGRYRSFVLPDTSRQIEFGRQVAFALAYFDCPVLDQLLRSVEGSMNDERAARDILEEISEVRTSISRWVVTVLVSNSGENPVAVMPYAELIVDTKDLTYGGQTIPDETLIQLELRGVGDEPSPLHVAGNSAELITFASSRFIGELEREDVLNQAYELGARRCYVRMFTAGGGILTRSMGESDPKPFRRSSASQIVTVSQP